MRAVHLVGPETSGTLRPRCGSWGALDTHWTAVASEVTCAACGVALRDVPDPVPATADARVGGR